MRDFKTLKIWIESIAIVKEAYRFAELLPKEEKYGLRSQICRSAVSIPSNIAEGCSRSSQKDFKRFLEIALGSAFELETQLMISKELFPLKEEGVSSIMKQLNTLQKMIVQLIKKVRTC